MVLPNLICFSACKIVLNVTFTDITFRYFQPTTTP